jgi:hypothetical protein
LPKGSLRWALQQIDQGGLTDIPKAMLVIDKMVARVKISIVLDHWNIPTAWTENAQGMRLPKGRPGCLFKDLHLDPADVLALPLVKDGAQKRAKRFRRHAAGTHATRRVGPPLDQGQKGHVLGLELLKEAVHLQGLPDVARVNHAEDLARDAMLL